MRFHRWITLLLREVSISETAPIFEDCFLKRTILICFIIKTGCYYSLINCCGYVLKLFICSNGIIAKMSPVETRLNSRTPFFQFRKMANYFRIWWMNFRLRVCSQAWLKSYYLLLSYLVSVWWHQFFDERN